MKEAEERASKKPISTRHPACTDAMHHVSDQFQCPSCAQLFRKQAYAKQQIVAQEKINERNR